jgi:hypothetical protein
VERPNQAAVRSSALPRVGGKARPGDRVRRRSHAPPRRRRGVARAGAGGGGLRVDLGGGCQQRLMERGK